MTESVVWVCYPVQYPLTLLIMHKLFWSVNATEPAVQQV